MCVKSKFTTAMAAMTDAQARRAEFAAEFEALEAVKKQERDETTKRPLKGCKSLCGAATWTRCVRRLKGAMGSSSDV
jgi:hypothetical protein